LGDGHEGIEDVLSGGQLRRDARPVPGPAGRKLDRSSSAFSRIEYEHAAATDSLQAVAPTEAVGHNTQRVEPAPPYTNVRVEPAGTVSTSSRTATPTESTHLPNEAEVQQ
jgi:hypothetical protein